MTELKKEIIENGIHYTLVGDYYFPDFAGSDEIGFVGKWAELHKHYLKEEKPGMYAELLFTNRMKSYLAEFNAQAEERFRRIVTERQRMEVSEAMKERDPMEWLRKMNLITMSAEELIMKEMVYC